MCNMIKDYNTITILYTRSAPDTALAPASEIEPLSSFRSHYYRGCGSQHVSSPHAVSSLKLLKSSKPKAARGSFSFSSYLKKITISVYSEPVWALFLIWSSFWLISRYHSA